MDELATSLLAEGRGAAEALLAARLLSCLSPEQGLQAQLGRMQECYRRLARDGGSFAPLEGRRSQGEVSDEEYSALLQVSGRVQWIGLWWWWWCWRW